MKQYLILLLMISTINVFCQKTLKIINKDFDSLVVSASCGPGVPTGNPILYPLVSDKYIEERKDLKFKYNYIYPLLIWNNITIRDEKQLNFFRNHIKYYYIKRDKYVSKEEAEKMGIQNVPKDGVLFITTKKKYYFDLSCE